MPLSINIDRERCMGSGNCAFHAPNTFDLDDEMKAIVIDPGGNSEDKISLAVDGCPPLAIWSDRWVHTNTPPPRTRPLVVGARPPAHHWSRNHSKRRDPRRCRSSVTNSPR